ncbi:MAG: glycosyltransferase [Firmicutes bacterium]|nr:glycosyltransferase [Bacillota bacterium]
MRVLMVNTAYTQGGAALVARTLHKAVNASPGHESFFAYGRGPSKQEPEAVRFASQTEVYFHAFLTRVTGIQGYGTWLSARRLLRLIRDWKPNIIHFHNLHGYYLDLNIAKAVGELGIPVIWTLHDAWPLTGRCAYFFECNRWRIGCGRCPDLRSYPRTFFDSSALMWPKKRELLGGVWKPIIVTPSQWLAGLVLEACAGRCRVEVIPNGVDTHIFRPRDRLKIRGKLGLPKDKKVVPFAAADLRDERKGARYFFESFNFVEADNWMVITAGKMVKVPPIFGTRVPIKQLGYLSGSETMSEIYSVADLFCITSLEDNFPTTVLESMSCGTPVVGFSVGGIPEQVTEGCGQLVPPRDARALGRAITALLNDDQLRRTMGIRCRERTVRKYSLERFSERYLRLYHELSGGCTQ